MREPGLSRGVVSLPRGDKRYLVEIETNGKGIRLGKMYRKKGKRSFVMSAISLG